MGEKKSIQLSLDRVGIGFGTQRLDRFHRRTGNKDSPCFRATQRIGLFGERSVRLAYREGWFALAAATKGYGIRGSHRSIRIGHHLPRIIRIGNLSRLIKSIHRLSKRPGAVNALIRLDQLRLISDRALSQIHIRSIRVRFGGGFSRFGLKQFRLCCCQVGPLNRRIQKRYCPVPLQLLAHGHRPISRPLPAEPFPQKLSAACICCIFCIRSHLSHSPACGAVPAVETPGAKAG